MNRGEALHYIESKITSVSGEFSRPEAESILQNLLKISRTELLLSHAEAIDFQTESRINEILKRRQNHEPLQYILGSTYFYDREFKVNSSVLIPRPDTETLVEAVLNSESSGGKRFIDLGTGSGIIAGILSSHCSRWRGIAADISISALRVARENLGPELSLICADMLKPFKKRKVFDFFVSNPPYISSRDIDFLDKSVIDYEPLSALLGGGDGLDFYRYLAKESSSYLKEGGRIYLEIGYDQSEAVQEILRTEGWEKITLIKDLERRPRVISACLSTDKGL
ncbi:peptide chain release factor N(5)-glutamine methyltransferase [Chitinispirillales bacterium ANBcel5]|uniref:peptide chain release factor N(5)-glutamine methyltransferase n=1 Tax=Cellulosispirillum alkaliphilum TaxID=3039283 RepID=UPI002A55DE72|nr:peptide chain release factor N(5)-glutamine methyltransferase [Chitinispirillales bacterium ANBcel5]